jgi:hypothetical protein
VLPVGHVLGQGCSLSDIMSEWRVVVPEGGNTDQGRGIRISGFTFFRGGLPTTRQAGLSTGVDPTAGWATRCLTCYYAGECVPSGGNCCSGTPAAATGVCDYICDGTTDGECDGFPFVYRHSTGPTVPMGINETDVTNCDYTAFRNFAYNAGADVGLCPAYYAQPIKVM